MIEGGYQAHAQRLAVVITNRCDYFGCRGLNPVWQADKVILLHQGIAVQKRPENEPERLGRLVGVLRDLGEHHKGAHGDGPHRFAGPLRQGAVENPGGRPIAVGQRCLEGIDGGLYITAVGIFHLHGGQPVFSHIAMVHIPNGTHRIAHALGHAVAAFKGQHPCRPGDTGLGAVRGFPFRADLAKVVRKVVGSARAIGTHHHLDRQVGQGGIGVQCGDLCRVPAGNFAHEDAAEDLAR